MPQRSSQCERELAQGNEDDLVAAAQLDEERFLVLGRLAEFHERVHALAVDRDDPVVRQQARLLNEDGRRAWEEHGVRMLYHTHSAVGFRRLMDLTDPRFVYLNPDLGWLTIRGGLDALQIVKAYRSRLLVVHFKDGDPKKVVDYQGKPNQGSIVPLGQGVVNFPSVVQFLKESDYAGFVMGELIGIGQYDFVRQDESSAYPVMYTYMKNRLELQL